jgi:DNA-binding NarL/FixJ family response regulator
MSRVLLCHMDRADERALLPGDIDLLECDEKDALVDQVAVHHPDVVIYELRTNSDADLAMLKLVRRIAPRTPFVVVGEEESPAWVTPADLRPLYYTPRPIERDELRGTLENALALR